jgi:ribosomal protein S18 acetylase RimI-like enzyme
MIVLFGFLLFTFDFSMIRIATQNDFDYIFALYMHPLNNPWLLYEQMGPDEFRPIYHELIARNSLYIYSEGGKDLGMFKLQAMKYRNSHIIYLGGVAVDPVSSKQGAGSRMMPEILERVKQMGFTRVELTVGTENAIAIKLYEKSGFLNEGCLRNYSFLKSENRYIDEYVMGLIL